jgi:hypothetical protein
VREPSKRETNPFALLHNQCTSSSFLFVCDLMAAIFFCCCYCCRLSLVEAVEQWVLQTVDSDAHLFFTAFRFVLQILYDEGEWACEE